MQYNVHVSQIKNSVVHLIMHSLILEQTIIIMIIIIIIIIIMTFNIIIITIITILFLEQVNTIHRSFCLSSGSWVSGFDQKLIFNWSTR